MISRLISTVRLTAVLVAIVVLAGVAQYYRDREAWLADAEACSIQGAPRIMSGPTVEEMVKNFQTRGIPADMEMFEP